MQEGLPRGATLTLPCPGRVGARVWLRASAAAARRAWALAEM